VSDAFQVNSDVFIPVIEPRLLYVLEFLHPFIFCCAASSSRYLA
jgi:hypothetical protein